MKTAVLALAAAGLLSGEPEETRCLAAHDGEVWTVPYAYDAATCLGLAIVACTRSVDTRVQYRPGESVTVYPPFRRCEARPYPGIEDQAAQVLNAAGP